MHVLRLQSCDTLWVLMYGISVERGVCMLLYFGLLFISLFRFRCCDIGSSNRKATVSCTLDLVVDTIQYSLFIYGDNYQIRSPVDVFFVVAFSLLVCSRTYAVEAHNEYACIMRTKFNWQHRASIECGSRVFAFAIA